MVKNIIEQNITPQVPNSIPNEHITVYVPIATNNTPGIASFYDKHFILVNGVVKINPEYIKGLSLDDYQKKTDKNLNTVDKTVVGAINEVDSKANNAQSKANAAYTLAENANSLVIEKPTVHFYDNFNDLLLNVVNSQIKIGDIYIIVQKGFPDFVVLDGNLSTGSNVTEIYIYQNDIQTGNVPIPEVGYIYVIEGIENKLIAIESGIQTPAIDNSLNPESENPVMNRVIAEALNSLGKDKQDKLDIEQEVNDSTNPVSSVAVNNTFSMFQALYDGKISTVEQVAKGAARSVAYGSYAAMVEIVNIMSANEFKVGDHILIRTMNVPDLWVQSVLPNSFQYSFIDDETFINELNDIGVSVGYFVLAPLETQKVALNDYVTNDTFNETVKEVKDELSIKYAKLQNSDPPIPLENNTIYIAEEPITKLYADLPIDENYICSLTFEVGENYDIRLYREDGEILYLTPLNFESGELWEINIMNNIVASGKVSRKVVSE